MSENIQSMSDALKANNPRSNSVPSNETGALPTALTSSGVPTLQSPGQIPATASAPSVAKPTSSKRTRSQKAAKAPSNPTADKAPTALAGVQSTEAPTETDPATAALASRLGLDADDSDDSEKEIHLVETKQPSGAKSAFASYKIPKLTTKSSDLAEWDDEAISKLVERAIAAAKAGNHDDSDLYFSMYRSVCTMKKPVGGKSVEVPKLALSSRAACSKSHAISTRAQEIVEVSSDEASEPGDLQFADEAMPRHDEMGFTPYFDKNIRNLKGPIPLTIFNKAWKDRAIIYHMEKRPKSDETSLDQSRYTGLPYPSEWAQSFSEWTHNHQGFYSTLKVEYKFKKFAKWLQIHKANCDALIAEDGFLVALRYDIQVRTNAFAHRVILADGSSSVANISVFRPKIAHSCYATARKNSELEFTDNPYAEGGARSNWDPTTGAPKHAEKKTAAPKATQPAQSTSGPNLPAKPTKAPRSGGYKGTNFIENYKPGQSGSQGPKPAFVPHDFVDDSSELQIIELLLENPTSPATKAPSVGSLQVSNQSWPSVVKCEMDIEEWSRALQAANLLPEFSDVIFGFQNGFSQGIPQHSLGPNLPFFTPPNHAAAWEAREKIEEKLQKEIREGRMFGPFSHQEVQQHFPFFRSNPFGAVINGDGSFRPTNDLSYPHRRRDLPSVNSFVNADDFLTTWDDFNIVSSFLRRETQPVHLAIFDWEKAYRQIPTAMDQWPFLMIQDFEGNLLLDTRITFGGVAGCGSFGRSADAWKLIMLHEFDLITIFRWVDDNLFVKRIDSQTSMGDIVARSNRLGVKTNEEKFSPFSPEQKYIGFLWNGVDKTVRLPDGKLFDRVDQIKKFLVKPSFYYKDVEIMVGRLNHVSYMLPQMRCYLCSCYRWLKSWRIRESHRDLPLDFKEDLE
ncbi:hypothetical protein PSTG_01390 [Puccinia striiformis f. sp. tritici PST-78]|uniref:Reverse transcriptase domain-containing protein n=1 Tax=Puccinia striiformis f. sp. tritici PST-78 TaxID=1165861 RepID=A0A0L0W254_9BASI|nr:hypothetical protein PSTG_01390 [Puccinia striiformis f. sp. tritici PST-78]